MSDRASVAGSGTVLLLTGLSGAGKTTLGNALHARLEAEGYSVKHLDGDILRGSISKDLGFSKEDRLEQMRRAGELAASLAGETQVVILSLIAPYAEGRLIMRSRLQSFIEVYVNAPLQVCEARDVKGLYKRAQAGLIQHFTGVDDPYEPPENPDVECRTDRLSLEECVDAVIAAMPSLQTDARSLGTAS